MKTFLLLLLTAILFACESNEENEAQTIDESSNALDENIYGTDSSNSIGDSYTISFVSNNLHDFDRLKLVFCDNPNKYLYLDEEGTAKSYSAEVCSLNNSNEDIVEVEVMPCNYVNGALKCYSSEDGYSYPRNYNINMSTFVDDYQGEDYNVTVNEARGSVGG